MIRSAIPRVWVPNSYPTSDGKPMAETDCHRILMTELIESLQHWFADIPTTYVSGNMLVYYEEGNKRKHLAPDVFVVTGTHKHERGNFLMWEEGRPLDVVIELTSKTTKREDLGTKFELYLHKLGVKEYFLFDPKEEYLRPSFQAFRRVDDQFEKIEPVDGRIPSEVLKLHLERSDWRLRLWDPVRGVRLLTSGERVAAEMARADQETARADQETARADQETARADQETARADQETARADQEAARAEAIEKELRESKAEVERLRRLLEQRHANGKNGSN